MKRTLAILLGAVATLAVSGAAQATTINGPDVGGKTGEVFEVFGGTVPDYAQHLTGFDDIAIGSILNKNIPLSATATLSGRSLGLPGGSVGIVGPGANHQLSLSAGTNGTVEADFTLTKPAHYFGFQFAEDDNGIPDAGSITFFGTGGQTLGILSLDSIKGDVTDNGDGTFFANFTSNFPITSIAFDLTGQGAKLLVDQVAISNVPIPAALPLFGAAIAGLGAMGKRRRNKAALAA